MVAQVLQDEFEGGLIDLLAETAADHREAGVVGGILIELIAYKGTT